MEQLTPEAVERLRRSVAMLTPGQMALKREDAIQLLVEVQRLQQRHRRVAEGVKDTLERLERRLGRLLDE